MHFQLSWKYCIAVVMFLCVLCGPSVILLSHLGENQFDDIIYMVISMPKYCVGMKIMKKNLSIKIYFDAAKVGLHSTLTPKPDTLAVEFMVASLQPDGEGHTSDYQWKLSYVNW